MTISEKTIIGRKDKADFPTLDLYDIDVKIDSGAYTSSIHCHNIELIRQNDKTSMVRFNLLDPDHPDYDEKEFLLPVQRIKNVKSSSGAAERRIFIKTDIILFGNSYPIELSLTDRSDMKYPVLLGRRLLKKGFIIDVARINLSYRRKKKSISKKQESK